MERAIALDNQIVPRGGHYASRIRPQLLAAYLDSAQQSMSRPPDGCRRVQQALRLDGSSSRAQTMARQCDQAANRILGEATAAERGSPDRARTLYQSVLGMVPQTSPAYTRARQRLDELRRTSSVDEDE